MTNERIELFRLLAAALSYPTREMRERVTALGEALRGHRPELDALLALEPDEGFYLRLFESQVAASPHETEYGLNRTTRKPIELADIAGFYRAFGVETRQDMVDHMAAELEFLAYLLIKEAYAEEQGWEEPRKITARAYASFLEDHAGRWLDFLAERVDSVAPGSFYALATRLAARLVGEEVARLGLEPARVNQVAPAPAEEMSCGGCPA
ncbi:MAG: hypothetical protein AMXMBFR33_31830 [Candidatus Xenobia bacterium]